MLVVRPERRGDASDSVSQGSPWPSRSVAALAAGLAGCGSGDATPTEVVLVTHDSFAISKQVKAAFERETGLTLRILQGGDAGEALNRALLTKGNPQGDVLFGIDNNLLSRALAEGLFEPYRSAGLDRVAGRIQARPRAPRDADRPRRRLPQRRPRLVREARDRAAARRSSELALPRYRGLLVVENPATSTPGLAFLLATVARYGETAGRATGAGCARTASSSSTAGSRRTRRSSPARRAARARGPIVVSYATSPAAEVIFAASRSTAAPTAVVEDSCFRQIELAGVLRGANNEKGAQELIDFMLSPRFQADVPNSMFVLPGP